MSIKAQCCTCPGFPVDNVVTPCKGKSTNTLSLLLPLQGVSFLLNSTQGVALGYGIHWAFIVIIGCVSAIQASLIAFDLHDNSASSTNSETEGINIST